MSLGIEYLQYVRLGLTASNPKEPASQLLVIRMAWREQHFWNPEGLLRPSWTLPEIVTLDNLPALLTVSCVPVPGELKRRWEGALSPRPSLEMNSNNTPPTCLLTCYQTLPCAAR